MTNKQELRSLIKNIKKTFEEKQLQAFSLQICHELYLSEHFHSASTILLYHALPDEPDTTPILKEWSNKKKLLLPAVVGNELELRRYRSDSELRQGAFGIQEPTGEVFSRYDEIDLAIIPGVAFTNQGKRLGRGKGYYDRLLPQLNKAYKIGICFPFQIVDNIPIEEHDVVMDNILSV